MQEQIKIRVVIQYPLSLNFGGLEIQAEKYIKLASAQGFDIDFLDYAEKELTFDILHIIGASIESCRIASLASKKGIKVITSPVFYKGGNLFLINMLYHLFSKLKIIPNAFSLLKQLFSASDLLLPNSMAETDHLKSIFPETKGKCKVLHNGVEREWFDDIKTEVSFREKFNITTPYLLCVSMIDKRKNILRLIQAFLQIKTAHTLVIVGEYRNFHETYNQQIKTICAENSDRILMIGKLSNSDPYLKAAYRETNMHVLPSKIETPGLSSLEAGLSGAHILVGDCPPVREYFQEHAIYCDPRSIKSIEKGLRRIIKEGDKPNMKIASFIGENYAWDTIGKKLASVYNNVLETSHAI